MNQNKICSKCILPEVPQHIQIGEDGICSVCKKFTNINIQPNSFYTMSSERKEQALRSKLLKRKGKEKYNCAVAVSGGKDSIMALYIAKRKLNLRPLAIFVDNGFSIPEMYENVQNAANILNVDLLTFRTNEIKNLFKIFLESKKQVYYCRVCHLLLDNYIKEICKKNGISLILGGYTKGQAYISQDELFWIYEWSDKNVLEILEENGEYKNLMDLFRHPIAYFAKNYKDIEQISPFKYFDYDEDEIVKVLKNELKFKVPEHSWPQNSTNCKFNFLSQYMARLQFGYSQHETEMSGLIRNGEITRERALEILRTPITDEDLSKVLDIMNLSNDVIKV